MAVLILHASDHVGHFVERAESGWPIGNGETCVVAGDEGTRDDQKERDAGGKDGETVQSLVVRNFEFLQHGFPETSAGHGQRRATSQSSRRKFSRHQPCYAGIGATGWRGDSMAA